MTLRVMFQWTLIGTNFGPGGTGRRVRISRSEEWKLDGRFFEEWQGHFVRAETNGN
jgi:hypothetical protein